MPSVDLVYDDDCPNVDDARVQLTRALSQANMPAEWEEWESSDAAAPSRVRGYGSPTILIAGKDVCEADPAEGAPCCRLYEHEGTGLRGIPCVSDIVRALEAAAQGATST